MNSFTKDHVPTYFICFTIVLLPDSPAPERRENQTLNSSVNPAQNYEVNMSDNSRLTETTGPRENFDEVFLSGKTTKLLHSRLHTHTHIFFFTFFSNQI